MATAVIRFEVIVPYISNESDPTHYQAVQTFFTNMETLFSTPPQALFNYQINNLATPSTYFNCFGYVTSSQQATALGYLTTLKNAIEPTYPVNCVTWAASTQP